MTRGGGYAQPGKWKACFYSTLVRFFQQKHNTAASWAILLPGLFPFKAEAKSMVSPPKVYWQALRIIKHRHNQT